MSEDSSTANASRSALQRMLHRHPIPLVLSFEGMLAVVALLLALAFGLRPWNELEISVSVLVLTLAATLPMVLALDLLGRVRWNWVQEIADAIRVALLPLFRNAPPGALVAVALMAGIGEELLFRGVIQAALEGWLGPLAGLLLASLLFGLAHFVTVGYLVLACLMGLYFGLLYQWTGNLLVPILVHALYDWVALRWYLRRYPDD
ncbi:MAG TPA: CPBP family intramembrane metalloprotease [Xanthomonadaceae bacterium]|nr:CPBP family intramembrane metalloprotease [Xanthomonadaceae bacterium]